MKFVMNHNNINVRDLDKSVKFYQEAFGLTIARVHEPEDFIIRNLLWGA